jgi:aldehyde dehydrogenase family 7 protein A1
VTKVTWKCSSLSSMIPPRSAAVAFRVRNVRLIRGLSNRASAILSSLDISTEEELSGVYDGQWGGTGQVLKSICPTTGEVLANVKSVRLAQIMRYLN